MEHRIRIRERRPRGDCSVPVEFSTRSTPPPTLVLTFKLGRQVILCHPTWAGDRLDHVHFDCPHCWERLGAPGVRLDEASGALTLARCVHCAGCGLHLHVDDGVASLFLPHYLLCARSRGLA